ncbi:unnamed protein product, partial [Medioppia subpectinata]
GKLDFDLSVKVYDWSQNRPIYEHKSRHSSDSFSAQLVYNITVAELNRVAKCPHTDCHSDWVLSVEVTNTERKLQANNFLLLSEPKNSHIIQPNIKVLDVKEVKRAEGSAPVGPHYLSNSRTFSISLSSETIAPFVSLDFRPKTGISGHFMENGFFIFDGKKCVIFCTESNVTDKHIRDNLVIKSVTDVIV